MARIFVKKTEEREKLNNDLYEIRKQKYTLESDIRKLEDKIKELDEKAIKERNEKYIELKERITKTLEDSDKEFTIDWDYYIFKANDHDEDMICLFDMEEWELLEFSKDSIYIYNLRRYDDEFDDLKEDAYSENNIIRNRWVEDVQYNYENCSLEDYMDWLSISDFDIEDIKWDADEPENDIYDMLDKMEELEEYKWDYDRDEYFLDLDITINL